MIIDKTLFNRPTLYIAGKTWGATKEFVIEHDLSAKLRTRYKDIKALVNDQQLRGHDGKDTHVVLLLRWEENEGLADLKMMLQSRRIPHFSEATFIENFVRGYRA